MTRDIKTPKNRFVPMGLLTLKQNKTHPFINRKIHFLQGPTGLYFKVEANIKVRGYGQTEVKVTGNVIIVTHSPCTACPCYKSSFSNRS